MPGPGSGPDEGRPDPDALLRAATREGRGRLKIFLGAAPGVGKTYEMLSEGVARRRDGDDLWDRWGDMVPRTSQSIDFLLLQPLISKYRAETERHLRRPVLPRCLPRLRPHPPR